MVKRFIYVLSMLAVVLSFSLVTLMPDKAYPGAISVDSGDVGCVSASAQPDPYSAVYCGIQYAIDDSATGDTIEVSEGSGTYNEDLTVNRGLTFQGDGPSTVTLEGVHTITSSNVTIDGFTLDPAGGIAITVDSSGGAISNITFTQNLFDLNTGHPIGILLGGYSSPNKVSNVSINDNTFDGPVDMISNPWKIGGWFGNPVSCEVNNVDFEHNTVKEGSIPINLQDASIDDILINDNTFRNTDGVVYVWGENATSPSGTLSNFVFTGNDVDSTNQYGVGIDVFGVFGDGNFGGGNRINFNNFVGIPGKYGFDAVSILSTLTSYELNAENNWWGDDSGPSGAGPGSGDAVSDNVDFDPWTTVELEDSKSGEVTDGGTFDAKDAADTAVYVEGADVYITVAEYSGNPGTAGFSGDIGKYIDVYIPDVTGLNEVEIKVYYTASEVSGKVESSLRLYWWDGDSWEECDDSGVTTSAPNPYKGYIWAKIRSDTTPTLNDLTGAPFGAAGEQPITTTTTSSTSTTTTTITTTTSSTTITTTTTVLCALSISPAYATLSSGQSLTLTASPSGYCNTPHEYEWSFKSRGLQDSLIAPRRVIPVSTLQDKTSRKRKLLM